MGVCPASCLFTRHPAQSGALCLEVKMHLSSSITGEASRPEVADPGRAQGVRPGRATQQGLQERWGAKVGGESGKRARTLRDGVPTGPPGDGMLPVGMGCQQDPRGMGCYPWEWGPNRTPEDGMLPLEWGPNRQSGSPSVQVKGSPRT